MFPDSNVQNRIHHGKTCFVLFVVFMKKLQLTALIIQCFQFKD